MYPSLPSELVSSFYWKHGVRDEGFDLYSMDGYDIYVPWVSNGCIMCSSWRRSREVGFVISWD
jgi:hypothetical protein